MTALRIANTVLAVLICAITIKWALVFFKPDSVEPLPVKTAVPIERTKSKPEPEAVKNLPLFTPVKKPEPAPIVKPVAPPINIDDLELKGIFANTENPKLSIAIIKVKGSSEVPAQVGDEIKPGVTLNSVGANYVILSYKGEPTRLGFPGRIARKGTLGSATGSATPTAIVPAPDDNNAPAFSMPPQRSRQASIPPRQLAPKPNVRPDNKRKSRPIVVAPALITAQPKAEVAAVSTPVETTVKVTEEMQAEPAPATDNTPAPEQTKTATPPTKTTADTTTTTSDTTNTTPDTSTNNGSDNQQNQGNDGGGETGGSNDENIPDFMNDNDGTSVDPNNVPDFMKDDQGAGTDVPAFMQ